MKKRLIIICFVLFSLSLLQSLDKIARYSDNNQELSDISESLEKISRSVSIIEDNF